MQNSTNIPAAIRQFAEVGRLFCSWAEGSLDDPQHAIRRAQALLAELYVAALQLPDTGIGRDLDAESISQDEWSRFYSKFGQLPVSTYCEVFDPLKDSEPITQSLADDLADIYRDIKAGLMLFDSHHSTEAAWDWRFNFQFHWGAHLLGALNAIHHYLVENGF